MEQQEKEHTGLLRLGLDPEASRVFWQRAPAEVPASELLAMARAGNWFPQHSEARVKYLVSHLQRRFPGPIRAVLQRWKPELLGQEPIVCHWHLQLTDPLYRGFTFGFLLPRWSIGSDELGLDQVQDWLRRRKGSDKWSPATLRRLASGLFSAATEAGLLALAGRSQRTLKKPQVNAQSIEYLFAVLDGLEQPVDPAPYLLTASWGELEVNEARAAGQLKERTLENFP